MTFLFITWLIVSVVMSLALGRFFALGNRKPNQLATTSEVPAADAFEKNANADLEPRKAMAAAAGAGKAGGSRTMVVSRCPTFMASTRESSGIHFETVSR